MSTSNDEETRPGRIRRGLAWWGRGWTGPIRYALGVGLHGKIWGLPVRAIRDQAARNRAAVAAGPYQPRNFEQVLEDWGITREQIPKVARGMAIQAWSWIILSVTLIPNAIYQMAIGGSWTYPVSAVLIAPAAVAVISTSLWRRTVLLDEHFTPFFVWCGIKKPEVRDAKSE